MTHIDYDRCDMCDNNDAVAANDDVTGVTETKVTTMSLKEQSYTPVHNHCQNKDYIGEEGIPPPPHLHCN